MSLSVIFACVWVVASAITAMLPMRRQYVPGITLLILAPILLIFIGIEHGVWIALLALLGAGSMFRNPLRYLFKRLTGRPVELPLELRGTDK